MLDVAISGNQEVAIEAALFPDAGQAQFENFDLGRNDAENALLTDAELERLVLAHLQDVKQIAKRILRRLPSTVQLDDLVQSGTLGLIDAAQRFDRSRPFLFGQYARIRIAGAIYDSLRELDWASRYMRTRQQKLENAAIHLEKSLGREPSSDEVAEAMGMDLDTFYEFASAVQEVHRVEIDAQFDDEHSVRDQLAADPWRAPDSVLLNKEIREWLKKVINGLPADERTVMFLYYFCEWRMEAIARRLHRTESRVSQIHSRAVARMRSCLNSTWRRSPPSRSHRRSSMQQSEKEFKHAVVEPERACSR